MCCSRATRPGRPGRTVGVQSLLALRLLEQKGKREFAELAEALLAAGGPLEGADDADRVAIVARFEADEPALFGWLRDAAYVTYYENPFVAEVINAKGQSTSCARTSRATRSPRFDLGRNTPRHGRGRYVPTDAVRRVDTSGLDLASDRTQTWGVKR